MEEVEETEREVLLDDQHGSNNSEDLSVGVDTLVTGIVHITFIFGLELITLGLNGVYCRTQRECY